MKSWLLVFGVSQISEKEIDSLKSLAEVHVGRETAANGILNTSEKGWRSCFFLQQTFQTAYSFLILSDPSHLQAVLSQGIDFILSGELNGHIKVVKTVRMSETYTCLWIEEILKGFVFLCFLKVTCTRVIRGCREPGSSCRVNRQIWLVPLSLPLWYSCNIRSFIILFWRGFSHKTLPCSVSVFCCCLNSSVSLWPLAIFIVSIWYHSFLCKQVFCIFCWFFS